MNCKKCGSILEPNARFCNICGEPVSVSTNVTPVNVTDTNSEVRLVSEEVVRPTVNLEQTPVSPATPNVSASEPVTPVTPVSQNVVTPEPVQPVQPATPVEPVSQVTEVTPSIPVNQTVVPTTSTVEEKKTTKKNNTLLIILFIIALVIVAVTLVCILYTRKTSSSVSSTPLTTPTTTTSIATSQKVVLIRGVKITMPNGYEAISTGNPNVYGIFNEDQSEVYSLQLSIDGTFNESFYNDLNDQYAQANITINSTDIDASTGKSIIWYDLTKDDEEYIVLYTALSDTGIVQLEALKSSLTKEDLISIFNSIMSTVVIPSTYDSGTENIDYTTIFDYKNWN
jgi:hypothetical protein